MDCSSVYQQVLYFVGLLGDVSTKRRNSCRCLRHRAGLHTKSGAGVGAWTRDLRTHRVVDPVVCLLELIEDAPLLVREKQR